MRLEEVEAKALQLSKEDRARLAQQLLASLEDDEEAERAWTETAMRRDSDLRSGSVIGWQVDRVLDEARDASRS